MQVTILYRYVRNDQIYLYRYLRECLVQDSNVITRPRTRIQHAKTEGIGRNEEKGEMKTVEWRYVLFGHEFVKEGHWGGEEGRKAKARPEERLESGERREGVFLLDG